MNTDNGIIVVTGAKGRIGDPIMRRFTGRSLALTANEPIHRRPVACTSQSKSPPTTACGKVSR